jgi:hypothetical protein
LGRWVALCGWTRPPALELMAVWGHDGHMQAFEQAPTRDKSISRRGRTGALLVAAVLIVSLAVGGVVSPSRKLARIPAPLSTLVAARPDVFLGLGWDPDGTPVIAFNPGVDTRAWEGQLKSAAGSITYRTRTCAHSLSDLEQVQSQLALGTWSPRATSISFALNVDPATCSVRLSSDQLQPSDIRELAARYGLLVTIDASGHVERLGDSG